MRLRKQAMTVAAILIAGLTVANCGGKADSDRSPSGGSPTSPSQQGGSGPIAPTTPPPPPSSTDPVRVQGSVAGLGGTCPLLSFTVGNERVRTASETEFRRLACTDIRNGSVVEVDGRRQTDGSLLAREVELDDEPAPAPPPPPGNLPIEVEGLIQNLTGSCPNLAFVVAGRRVLTTGATQFNRIPCALLQNGMDVEVDGTPDAGGVLVAREVQPDEVDLEGTVAGLTGTCPDRRFTVNGTPVVALASTRFDDITCGTLRDALRVEVRGIRRPDGSLLLTRVTLRGETEGPGPGQQEARVEGVLADLGGACPARSFSVSGRRVVTAASTRFDDTTCATLQAGLRVEVRGVSQGNGAIEATRVSRKN